MASSGPASLSPSVQASSETLNMAEDDASADLSALDKEIDRMRKDIESMIENRLRESTKPESKRFRMAIVPTLEILARYTEIRDAKLSEVGTVSVPARLPAGCDTMRKDIESSWNVGEALRGKHRLQTILRFLRERIYALMEAKQLILQRARTMLHQEEKLAQFHGAIVQQFNSLQTSLDDLLARYDRLRIAEEMQMGRSKKTSKPGDKNGAASAAQAYTSASPLRDPVELGDLKVYASHLARFHRSNRDFDTFRSRIAQLHST
ncbi:hypothetical protein BC828DRAFT_149863 [Blastocladiella britannica]|nr:hypothetical protein BC828DRAFT_149863 [Blastocladiella britannica]